MTPPASGHSRFGLGDFLAWNHRWNGFHNPPENFRKTVALMKESGAGWVRLEFILADFLQDGKANIKRYDEIIQALTDAGLSVLGLLIHAPTFSDKLWNQAPDFDNYIRATVEVIRRYGSLVRHWEVWNEPDHELFWTPQDGLFRYSQLLTRAYGEIKSEDPNFLVHLGGLSKSLPASLRQIYEHVGGSCFDVVHLHPFVSLDRPEPMHALRLLYNSTRKIMAEHGDSSKPTWFSEIACPGVDAPMADWWLGRNPTEARQAEWVSAIFGECLRWPGLEKIFWGPFRDTDNFFQNGVDKFGLIRNDFTPKLAFTAYQRAVESYRNAGSPLETLT
jgi:hypothetical protein